MDLPKKISYENLKGWVDSQTPKPEHRTVQSSDLKRIAGGLYRIREDYINVWSMKEDQDGRNYIVRADDDTDMRYIADDASPQNKSAYRVLKADGEGGVHVVWECDECNYPNITVEGAEYECGQCHTSTDEVFGQGDVQPAGMTSEDVAASYGPHVVEMMKKYALNEISQELAEEWSKEAANPDAISDGWTGGKTKSCIHCKKDIVPEGRVTSVCDSCLQKGGYNPNKKKKGATIDQFRKLIK